MYRPQNTHPRTGGKYKKGKGEKEGDQIGEDELLFYNNTRPCYTVVILS